MAIRSGLVLKILPCIVACIENCGSFVVSAVTVIFTYSDFRYIVPSKWQTLKLDGVKNYMCFWMYNILYKGQIQS